MDEPILVRLESAELAARERRLRAASEAEQRIAAARTAAAAVEAGTDDAIRDAVEALRERHRSQAAAEVAAIERELADLDRAGALLARRGERGPRAGTDDARLQAAVELVVGAVLGERPG